MNAPLIVGAAEGFNGPSIREIGPIPGHSIRGPATLSSQIPPFNQKTRSGAPNNQNPNTNSH
jgi:hypothetical protein